jgi:hypothetical protein
MADPDNILAVVRRVPLAQWVWWIATVALWPAWLLLVLGVQLAVFVGVEAVKAPTYGALIAAVVAATAVCVVGSWFLGGTAAVNGAPRRLWSAPAVYGAAALVGVIAVDVVQWLQGVPGPLPWMTATTLGFVLISMLGILPAFAAVAFRIGVRSAGSQIGIASTGSEVGAPPR